MKSLSVLLMVLAIGCGSDATTSPTDSESAVSDVATTGDTGATDGTDGTGGTDGTDATDGTGGTDGTEATDGTDTTTFPDDLDMTAEDFDCILEGTKVGSYYLINKLGKLEEAVAVANSPDGGTFPVGTVIQLVPFEAMVKRKAGFSTETRDWEFFALEAKAEGTTIAARGTTDVVNQFGGNCFTCHAKSEAKWDFICGADHGCDPLGLSPQIIESVQNSDARCGSE